MGNYTILTFAAENIVREFIYGGPHTLFGRTGRFSNPPPQFGQTLCRCVSTQSAQKVHS